MTRILIAPNAFKGALDAKETAHAIAAGLGRYETILFPIADGGDGSLPVLVDMLQATMVTEEVTGPLQKSVMARYGWIEKTRTVIIELAEASGIRLVARKELNPWQASTFGTGELIQAAVDRGASEILLTLGGSATVDGGIGILSALGVRFFNERHEIPNPLAGDLEDITRYDASRAHARLRNTMITILSDVENTLLGEEGAAAVFGPQKGASAEDVSRLEKGLASFADVIKRQEGTDIREVRHGGAAGGVAAVLHGVFRARLVAGAPYILKLGNFESLLAQVDVVITGEGKLDQQTLSGKGPAEVALMAKRRGKKVIGVCGVSELGNSYPGYFDEIIGIADRRLTLEENMRRTRDALSQAGDQVNTIF